MYVKNGTGVLKRVLLSKPQYLKAAPINEIARKWAPELNRPNSVFARDFGGCVREGYILGRFREPLRFQEHTDYERRMKELGVPVIVEVKEGLFEGGDFMFLDEHTIALGMFARTDEKGFEEIKAGLAPYGYEVLPVPGPEAYLHLDMCFNLVDDHIAVAYPGALTEDFKKELAKREIEIEIVPVPEEAIFAHGCNLQAIGDHRVLSLARNTRVNEELRKRGMTVIELPVTEILKAGGGPHCMTFPLERI